MKAPLTEKQADVLIFIFDFYKREGWAPTRREIADYFEWRSINAADTHIKALVRKGWLKVRVNGGHLHRNIQIVSEA